MVPPLPPVDRDEGHPKHLRELRLGNEQIGADPFDLFWVAHILQIIGILYNIFHKNIVRLREKTTAFFGAIIGDNQYTILLIFYM